MLPKRKNIQYDYDGVPPSLCLLSSLARRLRPIDSLYLEIVRRRTPLEHHLFAPNRLLPRIPAVLARLAVLVIVFPETDHQAGNEHRRFVLRVRSDDAKLGRLGARRVKTSVKT